MVSSRTTSTKSILLAAPQAKHRITLAAALSLTPREGLVMVSLRQARE
jgi:hypothetical protein